MSLKINDRFRISRDSRNWILEDVSHYTGKEGSKNEGKAMERVRESYFGSLELLCNHCIDRSLDPEQGFEMMQVQLVNVHADLKKAIRKQGLEAKRIIMEASK